MLDETRFARWALIAENGWHGQCGTNRSEVLGHEALFLSARCKSEGSPEPGNRLSGWIVHVNRDLAGERIQRLNLRLSV